MSTLILPKSDGVNRVKPSLRTIAALGGSYVVLDDDGNPAAGRIVLILARSAFGSYTVVAETVTSASGTFTVTVNASINDRFVVVVLGDVDLGEYSVALNGIEAAT